MNASAVEKVANAILYEGYILYPYRASAAKNRQRWNFGTLAPGEFMLTECLVTGTPESRLGVKVRFLQMAEREGQIWNEATDRSVRCNPSPLGGPNQTQPFRFGDHISGAVEIESVTLRPGVFRIGVRVNNVSAPVSGEREKLLLHSLVSTHTILTVDDGAFVSLLDPPPAYSEDAALCRNLGTWPVLAGEDGSTDTMLSSPIVLYDYPKVAPESSGDYFDGTEMDEMLALRVLTLTDEEKREMRGGDERARRILERTETMPEEQMMKLHGAVRGMRALEPQAAPERIPGTDIRKGDRVRLRPKKGGDIFDIALEGMVAVVDSLERDFEDRVHIAVVVEDDPGRDFGSMRQPGHRFFFSPEEVELLAASEHA